MKHENMNEYALPFAAWDLRLYLDTHPEDECALREYRRLCAMAGGHCNYACHTPDGHVMPNGGATPYAGARGNVSGDGCGCGDSRLTRANGGGGNYGGNRCDNGNFRTARAENGGNVNGCGCGDNAGGSYNVWSWIDGPWPWEPAANGGDC